MVAAIACSVVASLALSAVDAEVGLRAESRTSRFMPSGAAADTQAGWLAAGRARLAIDVGALRLTGTYAPRFSTTDAQARPSPVASQEAEVRVETHHAAQWNVDGEVNAVRGRTDPLADPWQAIQARGSLQTTTLEPIPFQALRAGGGATWPIDLRTTLAGRATGWSSGGTDAEARASLPTQRGAWLDLSLAYLASHRDTIRIQAIATGTTTALAAGDARAGWTAASARWRRRLSPSLDGWLGGGATLALDDAPLAPMRRTRFAVGEAGLGWELPRTSISLETRIEPYIDRLTSEVGPMALASGSLQFRWSPRLALSLAISAGTRPGGATSLATAQGTARYTLREGLGVEAGLVARRQYERSPQLPSFSQAALLVALTLDSGPL